MKKLLSIVATFCLVLNLQAKTSDFNLDEKKVNAEFSQLNKLENYVDANANATIADAKVAELAADVNLDTTTVDVLKELPAGIPAFWWGFCLTWVGLIVVYVVTDNDKDEVKKALKGCIISGLIYAGIWVLSLVGIFATGAGI